MRARTRSALSLSLSLALTVAVAGCAARSAGSRPPADMSSHPPAAPQERGDILGADEIATAKGASTALDAIRQLRPLFLRRDARLNATDKGAVSIYLNTMRLGGVEALATIPVSTIREIRYLTQTEAARFVKQNVSGAVIQVVTWTGSGNYATTRTTSTDVPT